MQRQLPWSAEGPGNISSILSHPFSTMSNAYQPPAPSPQTRRAEQLARPASPAAAARPPATDVAAAYRTCRDIATSHYENFTIGSWLLPRHLRLPLAAVYAFARTADDFADEGDATPEQRLDRLAAWEQQLEACLLGEAHHPIFVALGDAIVRHDLPIQPFRDLLRAFRADAVFEPFANAEAMFAYCRLSANPVGRIVLALFGYRDTYRTALSDDICTGLQLANFAQDIALDATRRRVYVPLDELAGFDCTPAMLGAGKPTPALRALVAVQAERAERLLRRGVALAETVERRYAREIVLFAHGGLAILTRIEELDYDVFTRRPILGRRDKLGLVWRALIRPRPERSSPSAAVRS